MFKDIGSGLQKLFTRDRLIIFILVVVLGYALFIYSGSKGFSLDGMGDGTPTEPSQPSVKTTSAQNYVPPPPPSVPSQTGYSANNVANPADLLPRDSNSEWSSLNPTSNQGGIVMPDLLQAGYHIGLDTIGQTLRNANQQLRSDPIIPKKDVGPWNVSTIEPDIGRTPLEIGNCR